MISIILLLKSYYAVKIVLIYQAAKYLFLVLGVPKVLIHPISY